MTQEELKEDILSKIRIKGFINRGYFKKKLFKKDRRIFDRRSFDDLFLYYRKYGVTEKELLKALLSLDMGGKYVKQYIKWCFVELIVLNQWKTMFLQNQQ